MLEKFIQKICGNQSLSSDESREAFDIIFTGDVYDDEIVVFLTGLRDKGETAQEIQGAVASMRNKALTINAPLHAVDIVGTGGDMHGTYNISTASAFTVAGCGVPVAKHGNRSSTSRSGSSDVLEALGINLESSFAVLENCLEQANLCFMFAPRHHPAMRSVINARKKIGTRTIFNLLGPMTNPANVKRHLIGVYAKQWLRPMAETLQSLGSQAAWTNCGRDGMDELSTLAPSDVVALEHGEIREFSVMPTDVGIQSPDTAALRGGDADFNAVAIHRLLSGEASAYRDAVVLNSGAALVVSGKIGDLAQGMDLAAQSLDSGAARGILEKTIEITNRYIA